MISVIVAVAQNGVIGCENRLIWHISEDLRRFKAITAGHPVIMGRKTWESLGRPLPNRTNVVVTRNPDYRAEGCTVVNSLDEAMAMFGAQEEIFIIGGAEIYSQAMPVADKLYITVVHADYEGDTVFPKWDRSQWTQTLDERHERGEKFDKPFSFMEFIRNK